MEDLIRRIDVLHMIDDVEMSLFSDANKIREEYACRIMRFKLAEMPVVDGTPVVRCADCIHSTRSPWGHPTLRWCPILDSHKRPDWFCADGRKKDE